MRRTLLALVAAACLASDAAGADAAGRAEAATAAQSCAAGEGAGERCIASSALLQSTRSLATTQAAQYEDGGAEGGGGEEEELHEADPEEGPAEPQEEELHEADLEEGPAELQEAAAGEELVESDGARALLSRRGCPSCVCFAEDGARCGYSVVKDIGRCGAKVTKICKRKKWKVSCSFKKTAKSCKVANKCKFTESFSDCLGDLGSSFSSQGKDFMKMITKTGCTSVSKCKKEVTDGLADAWREMRSEVMAGGKAIFRRTGVSKVGDTAVKAYGRAGEVVQKLGAEAGDIGAAVMQYIGNQLPAWQKYDLGSVCAPADRGFWYLYPSDCGAFSSMAKIFNDMGSAGKHFGDARSAFNTCVGLKGLLGVPTPFIKVGWTHFCLYQPLVTAMEYLIGGIGFAAAAAATLIGHVRTVVNELNSLAGDLGLVQMAKELHAHRRGLQGGGNGTALPALAQAGADCGPDPTWSVEVGLGWSASYAVPGQPSVGFGVGTAIVIGCKGGTLLPPNWLLGLDFFSGIQFINEPEKGVETGLEVSLKFDATYPSFVRRTDIGLSMTIAPEANLNTITGGAIPIAAAVPVEFPLSPPDHPTAFALGLKPEADSAFAQLGREARAASEESSRLALERGANPALAAIAGSLHAVAGRRAELRAALATSLRPRAEILAHAKVLDQHKAAAAAALIERAQRRLAGTEKSAQGGEKPAPGDEGLGALQEGAAAADFPVEVGLESKVGFSFCITPTKCFGQ